jgi:[ribosomal protein S5]-alanine N-acetyltransferase
LPVLIERPAMHDGRMVLETERTRLIRLKSEDSPFILEVVNDPSFIENIGDRGVRTLSDAEAYIKRVTDSYERHGFGLYRVELKDSKESIGISGLVKRDTLAEPDVGFAFLPKYWLKGYAVETAQAVLNYARDELKIKRVLGITSPKNVGSVRVLEKIGLKFDGVTKLVGDDKDVKLFSIQF